MRLPFLPTPLLDLAADQGGVITVAQALAAGLTYERIRGLCLGEWRRLSQGIFCTTTPTWESAVWAGLLRGGDGAVVGGEAAARLHGLTRRDPHLVPIWVPRGRVRRHFWVGEQRIQFRQGSRPSLGHPRRLPVPETLVDYSLDATEDELMAAVTHALGTRRTTAQALGAAFKAATRAHHRLPVEDLLSHADNGVHSLLEWRYWMFVERAHRLPTLTRQDSRLPGAVFDGTYEDHQLVIEVDGREFHDEARDRRRDNRTVLTLGWATLRYGWRDVVGDPCRVAEEVALALSQRGWDGALRRCYRCAGPRSYALLGKTDR